MRTLFKLSDAFLIKFSRVSELKCAIRKIILEFGGMHQVLSIQRPFNDIGLGGELTQERSESFVGFASH